MKIFKQDSPLEQKVQQIENMMSSLGISIQYTHDGLCIQHNNNSYPITDTQSKDVSTSFPRQFDSERIKFCD